MRPSRVRVALNAMTAVLMRRERERERFGAMETDSQGGVPCEDTGRNWSDEATSQGNYQKMKEAGKDSPLQSSEGTWPS